MKYVHLAFVISACILYGTLSVVGAEIPVQLEISTPQMQFPSGSPITLTITLSNLSDVPMTIGRVVGREQAEVDYTILVKDTNGKLLPESKYGYAAANNRLIVSRTTATIPPGGTLSQRPIITRLYDMTKPGKYVVTVQRRLPAALGGLVVASNAFTVSVVLDTKSE